MAPSLEVVLFLAALGLVLRTRDYNLAPSALVVAFSKIKWGVFDKDFLLSVVALPVEGDLSLWFGNLGVFDPILESSVQKVTDC